MTLKVITKRRQEQERLGNRLEQHVLTRWRWEARVTRKRLGMLDNRVQIK